MQYSVPQFVEIEDKIIGPLTLKQFLTLLVGGLFGLMFYSIFNMSAFFFVLMLPTTVVFLYLAFGKLNGRPVLGNIPTVVKFLITPKVRMFARTGEGNFLIKKKEVSKADELAKKPEPEAVSSRLKRLAYILDEKAAEEQRLIHSGDMQKKWINQI